MYEGMIKQLRDKLTAQRGQLFEAEQRVDEFSREVARTEGCILQLQSLEILEQKKAEDGKGTD